MQRQSDLPDLAAGAGGLDLGEALAPHDQRARINEGQIIAAGPMFSRSSLGDRSRSGLLAHRDRFSGQERLVDRQIVRVDEHRVRRNSVTFSQHEDIATNDLASRDPPPLAIPDHERSRTGQFAQRLQHPFGAGLLHDGDGDGNGAEGQQKQRLAEIAEQQIDQPA